MYGFIEVLGKRRTDYSEGIYEGLSVYLGGYSGN
jgi:hypothetical protein